MNKPNGFDVVRAQVVAQFDQIKADKRRLMLLGISLITVQIVCSIFVFDEPHSHWDTVSNYATPVVLIVLWIFSRIRAKIKIECPYCGGSLRHWFTKNEGGYDNPVGDTPDFSNLERYKACPYCETSFDEAVKENA